MENSPIKKRLTVWNFIFFALGVLVLVLLLLQINFQDLIQLIVEINITYLFLGAGLYLCKGLIRALRFTRVIDQSQTSYPKMVRLTFASSLASQVLPFKLGELTYVYLLKRENRASISSGLSSLLVIRLLDLLAVALLFILAALFFPLSGSLAIFFGYILGFIVLLLAGILLIIFISGKTEFLDGFLSRIPWVQKYAVLTRLKDWGIHFLLELKPFRWSQYIQWAALASLEWAVNFAVFHSLLLGFGLNPSIFDTVTSVTFSVLASVLPINSLGNFGTQEVGWSAALTLLGYSKEAAISSGFATHLITLGYFLIYGGLSWISYLFSKND